MIKIFIFNSVIGQALLIIKLSPRKMESIDMHFSFNLSLRVQHGNFVLVCHCKCSMETSSWCVIASKAWQSLKNINERFFFMRLPRFARNDTFNPFHLFGLPSLFRAERRNLTPPCNDTKLRLPHFLWSFAMTSIPSI